MFLLDQHLDYNHQEDLGFLLSPIPMVQNLHPPLCLTVIVPGKVAL